MELAKTQELKKISQATVIRLITTKDEEIECHLVNFQDISVTVKLRDGTERQIFYDNISDFSIKEGISHVNTGQAQLLLIILGIIIVGVAIAVGLSMFSVPSEAHVKRTIQVHPKILRDSLIRWIHLQPLGLQALKTHEGLIETNYEYYSGDEKGLLWWKKRYQERCRYIIEIQSAIEMRNTSILTITAQVEERVNENYPWNTRDISDYALQRIQTMLTIIDSKLRENTYAN